MILYALALITFVNATVPTIESGYKGLPWGAAQEEVSKKLKMSPSSSCAIEWADNNSAAAIYLQKERGYFAGYQPGDSCAFEPNSCAVKRRYRFDPAGDGCAIYFDLKLVGFVVPAGELGWKDLSDALAGKYGPGISTDVLPKGMLYETKVTHWDSNETEIAAINNLKLKLEDDSGPRPVVFYISKRAMLTIAKANAKALESAEKDLVNKKQQEKKRLKEAL